MLQQVYDHAYVTKAIAGKSSPCLSPVQNTKVLDCLSTCADLPTEIFIT